MSQVQMLRAVVEQRLTAAVEEIFELVERTIVEYEEEIDRQRRLLEDVVKPEIQINTADGPQLLVSKEEVPPEQQQWSPSLDQEDPEPPQIKEEQEELWISQEGEPLQGLEETDITKFPFTPVPVKSEDDEEGPQFSQLHQSQSEENREAEPLASTSTEQMKTEADRGSKPASNLDPASDLQPASDYQLLWSHCSEPQTLDSDDFSVETSEPHSGLDTLKNNEVLGGHIGPHTGRKPFSCSVCAKGFNQKGNLNVHMKIHTGENPFSCSVCGKTFYHKGHMHVHMRSHTGDKPFSCSVCGKTFYHKGSMHVHMRSHTGENPFSCSVCGKRFNHKGSMHVHMRSHTGEKPFSCSVCGKGFNHKGHMHVHMRSHTGDKPFSCAVCSKRFNHKGNMLVHMRSHTGDKPFSCAVCSKGFNHKGHMHEHMRSHTGEKPFSCSVFNKF